jgi:hypothetical protein
MATFLTTRQKLQIGFWGTLVAIFAIIFAFAPAPTKPAESQSAAAPAVKSIDKSPEMQRKRQEFIDSMIKQGVFSKVEMPGSVPYVWVRARFNTIDFESKTTAMSIVYAFYFSDMAAMNFVGIRDNMNGKTIGTYSPGLGLKMK